MFKILVIASLLMFTGMANAKECAPSDFKCQNDQAVETISALEDFQSALEAKSFAQLEELKSKESTEKVRGALDDIETQMRGGSTAVIHERMSTRAWLKKIHESDPVLKDYAINRALNSYIDALKDSIKYFANSYRDLSNLKTELDK